MSDLARKASAEMLGTFLLVFIAVGAAVASLDEIGALGVALAFGFVLLALAYALGPVSGCHVNPAVTLAVYHRPGGRRLLERAGAGGTARRCRAEAHDVGFGA